MNHEPVLNNGVDRAEVARVDALDTGVRSGPDPDVLRAGTFDRVIPED